MSYVPANSRMDLLAMLAAAAAAVVGVEWLWRRLNPRAPDDDTLAGDDVNPIDRAGDPFPNGEHPQPPHS